MEQIFQHKGYLGSVELSMEDEVLHGKLLYINDLVTYEGDTIPELKTAFIESVEDYISFCEKNGKSPEKPFKGSFNIRIPPELHRADRFRGAGSGSSKYSIVYSNPKK